MAAEIEAPRLVYGQPLVVRYETKLGDRSFDSAVGDIVGERVHILPPAGPPDDLYPGKQVDVVVMVDDSAYQFITRVLSVGRPFVLARPDTLRLVEKRQHFRLELGIVPAYAAVTDANGVDERSLRLTALNISAGGVKFVSRRALSKGDLIHMWLPLDDYRVDCMVEVVNALSPGVGRSNYRYNTQFRSISHDDRERLARFVFRKQIELRRRS